MRDNWFFNRVFTSYDDLVSDAWNNLTDQPWTWPAPLGTWVLIKGTWYYVP
jgi:hypothetical protein